ncbi:hypothetical protein OV203_17455 [Nannocystis sp. ILAH1]|uniref:hypothetical protein n=1 Tax=unclassified Nannocystis TaxID=2627009 RepID=UPI00226D9AB1|nr:MULTISPECIES: hypothetical protein [unclassified Nannocystis]MCY0988927.1 hypothetical protein [Nannocystis sp. ILAH1]MCY1072647.1 hypothetical protein [Nannocystis sp. RBIL2]
MLSARRAALSLVCFGALALAWTFAPAEAAAAPSVGPPPKLPDIGPPPMLPDVGPQNVPPTSPAPSTPPTTTAPAPVKPAPGPPVMRPTVRPTPAPTPPAPPVAAPEPPADSVPPPAAPGSPPTASPVPTPPPPVSSGSPPDGDPLQPEGPKPSSGPADTRAPMIEGADPTGAEAKSDKPAEPKSQEDIEEEAARARRKQPKKWRHAGLIVEPRFGTLGCTRQFCAGSNGHGERPGALLGGFIGGNLLGLLDIGIEAQWGTLRPRDIEGKNAVALYGIDPARLEQALSERLGTEVDVDFNQLIVNSAKARAVSAGPALRIHFLRKGRGVAYIGTGIHYQLWRNRYETTGGPTRMDFHGFVAPFRVGGGAFVHPNIAVTGEFAYHYAFYVITGVSHPELSGVAPLSIIEGAALDAGTNLRKGLPHFWSFSVSVRFRLGL